MLKKAGYEVGFAVDGISALESLQTRKPDLIILDIMMPRMDGVELCQRLKSKEETSHIPVIFLTSQNKQETVIKGFESGAVDYVFKQCSHVELLARVNTHLELKRTKEQLIKENAEQKELLHVLCHDLVNPLGAINNLLTLSRKKSNEWLADRREKLLQITQHGLNVIELIRKLRYLEEKEGGLILTKVNLKQAIDESYLILRQQFNQKEIEFDYTIDESLNVQVEKTTFINSVLNNILTNAIKFSHPKSRIIISSHATDDSVVLTVRDYGIGMPSIILDNLFIIGKGRSRTGTAGERGTGFGMPLMKNFMTAYGGSIEIWSQEASESNKNHGTKVKLILKRM